MVLLYLLSIPAKAIVLLAICIILLIYMIRSMGVNLLSFGCFWPNNS